MYFSPYQKLCIVVIYLLNYSVTQNSDPTCQVYVLREALGNDTYRVWMTPPPDHSSIRDVKYYQATDSFKQCYNESERKDGCIFVTFGWQYFYISKGQSIVIDDTTFMDVDDILPLLGSPTPSPTKSTTSSPTESTTSSPTESTTSSPTESTTFSPTESTTSSPTESTESYSGKCHPTVYVFLALLFAVSVILIPAVIVLSCYAYSFWKRLKSSSRNTIGTWQSESLQNYLRDSFEKRIDFHMVKLEYAAGTLQLRAGQFLYRNSHMGKLVSIFVYTEEVPPEVIQSLGEGFVFLVSETDCRGPLTVLPALSAQDGRINDLTAHLRSCMEMERVPSSSDVVEGTAPVTQADFGIEEKNRQPPPSRNDSTTATNRAESDGVVTSSSGVAKGTPADTHEISSSAEETTMVRQGRQLSLPTSQMEAGTSGTTQTTLL